MRKSALRRGLAFSASVSLSIGFILAPLSPAHAAGEVHANSAWLMSELLKLESGTQNGGIYANKPGYHNTRAQNDPDNYSVRDAEDKGGPANLAAAYDWTFPEAQGFGALSNPDFDAQPVPQVGALAAPDYSGIAKYSQRLLASGRDDNDPRLDGWKEFFGQADSDSGVEGYDFRRDENSTSDESHLWHIHLSEDRDKVPSLENKQALLSVLRGESVAQWRNKGTVKADFDGDGASDFGVYRAVGGTWHIKSAKRNVQLYGGHEYGGNGSDIPLTGDFDGDGYADIALYRKSEGQWHIKSVKRNVQLYASYPYGGNGSDIPLTGDFDGDGFTDIALYRASEGTWHIKSVKRNLQLRGGYEYGGNGSDKPVAGDFDGDGSDDIGLYRATGGTWHLKSVKRDVQLYGGYEYGGNGSDIPQVGDFDGDGTDDIGLYRKSEGEWHLKSVKRNVQLLGSHPYGGNPSDVPFVK